MKLLLLLLLLLLFGVFNVFDVVDGQVACVSTELLALTDLYNSAGGENWINKTGWASGESFCCNWFGVACSSDSVVILDLDGNNLVGTLPATLSYLANVRVVDFSSNTLSSIVPVQVFELAFLQTLDLSANRLTGSLPSSISSLSLDYIDLSSNGFTGELPTSLPTPLTYLDLSFNDFSGRLPNSWQLSNSILQHVFLNNNKLNGVLPVDAFNENSTLREIHLENNGLEGVLPPWLTTQPLRDCTSDTVSLSGNVFYCPIDPTWSLAQSAECSLPIILAISPSTACPDCLFSLVGERIGYPATENIVIFYNLDGSKEIARYILTILDDHVRAVGVFPSEKQVEPGQILSVRLSINGEFSDPLYLAVDNYDQEESDLHEGIIAFLDILAISGLALLTFVYSMRFLEGFGEQNLNYNSL